MGMVNDTWNVEWIPVGMAPNLTAESLYSNTFKVTKKSTAYSFSVGICKCPTGNCQLSSVLYMNQILVQSKANSQNFKKDVLGILQECYKLIKWVPQLMFMDVNQVFMSQVEACFTVVTKSEYISTNGSKMCLYLVKPGFTQ